MKSKNRNHLKSNKLNKTLKTKLNLFKITQTHNFKPQKQTKITNFNEKIKYDNEKFANRKEENLSVSSFKTSKSDKTM